VTSVQPTGLPWLSHINTTTGVQVTGVHIHNDLDGFLCPDLTIHLNNAMDFVELTGEERLLQHLPCQLAFSKAVQSEKLVARVLFAVGE
jgi:hypothetical protein